MTIAWTFGDELSIATAGEGESPSPAAIRCDCQPESGTAASTRGAGGNDDDGAVLVLTASIRVTCLSSLDSPWGPAHAANVARQTIVRNLTMVSPPWKMNLFEDTTFSGTVNGDPIKKRPAMTRGGEVTS
jgi:hypothetical protein